jgi:hypothetical protein
VPYLSRNPIVSLVQSAVEEQAHAAGAVETKPQPQSLWHRFEHFVELLVHERRFGPEDPNWVIKIAEQMLQHLARGNHPFNPEPAVHEIADDSRFVVVGDWGTGLPRAQLIAREMQAQVAAGLAAGRQVHVIHLGDIYYSGTPSEDERHVLRYWPVTPEQAAAGVTSWSLNGNHDMYSGGFGYFQTLLADPRFRAQHSPDGAATSYFRLTSPSWEFVGLDTAWQHKVFTENAQAVLEEPQAGFVERVAAESDRKLVLFSHHQLVSVYDTEDIGEELKDRLSSVLDSRRVTAWWWGHEHRSMAFKPSGGVQFPRCLGHGGVPVIQTHGEHDPIPEPGLWEDRTVDVADGQRWAKFGFAVLDLNGPQIDVSYIDQSGTPLRTEHIA